MKQKILIVDDVLVNRKQLANILKDTYEVLEACNGLQALELMESAEEELSAVLLDLIMPKMNGYEVLRHIQADSTLSKIPVIVTTGSTEVGAEIEALKIGAIEYITKPYHSEIIKQRLQNIIKLREDAAIVNAIRKDALTGLYSREAFFAKAAEMISQQKPGHYVMACFDIEKFKVINDQYGNAKGDEVLKMMANLFKEFFQQYDGICSRIMADNYAALYPSKYMHSKAIREMREKAEKLDGSILPITFGIGRYIVDDLSLSPSAMYDRAALAKNSVKGRFDKHVAEYDESMRNKILQEQEIISEMRQALKSKQFEVWFQPQYSHSTGAIVGAEALVRWKHPVKGYIYPDMFIPIFEKNGFIYEMDKFVWEQACAFQKQCAKAGNLQVPVSVNISRYDIFQGDLVEVIVGLTKKYDLPTNALHLEITETAFTKSSQQIIQVVKDFQALGFVVEIDDFGSGYSSLHMLKDVPADVVKLDMRFLEGEDASGRGGSILESIVRMTRWIGIEVVAEGVETIEQAEFLKTIGCDYLQGYLYARPMPAKEYLKLYQKGKKEKKQAALMSIQNLDNSKFWSPQSLDTLIFNSYIGSACVLEYYGNQVDVLRANEKYARAMGDLGVKIEDALSIKWLEHLDEKDILAFKAAVKRSAELNDEVKEEFTFRNLPGCAAKTYLRTTLRVIAKSGEHYLIYCTSDNITELREAEMKEQKIAEQMQSIMENVSCGITATIQKGEEVEYLFINNKYFELVGYSREEYEKEIQSPYDLLHPEDRERIFTTSQSTLQEGESREMEYRVIRKDQKLIWVKNVISRTRFKGIKEPVQLGILTDITEKKQAEEAGRIHKEEMQIAMSKMGKMICEYNPVTRQLTMPEAYANWYQVPTVYDNIPYSLVETEFIEDSCKEGYVKFYESIINGEKAGTFDARLCRADGTWHNEHYEFVSIFNDEGKPIKTIFSVEDITKQVETRRRYEHEVQLRRELMKDAFIYYELNLSTNMIEEYRCKYSDTLNLQANTPITEKAQEAVICNVVEEDKEKVRQLISAEALRKMYERGERSLSLEYLREVPKEGLCWVQANVALMQKPETEEIIAFMYVHNIDTEKKTQLALDSILEDEIDDIMILNVRSGRAFFAKKSGIEGESDRTSFDYQESLPKLIREDIFSEDKETCEQFFQIENLQERLDKEPVAMCLYRIVDRDKKILRKRAVVYYLEESHQDMVISCRDITALFEEEQHQKQVLQKAVDAANRANQAKSNFLSKMSHDMRTPLNAILAFSNEEMTGDAGKEQLKEYLDKIHNSGDYLLGIINDVLDMSKIEQNKMILNAEPYEFNEFVKTIKTVIDELCRNKKIIFSMNICEVEKHVLKVDKTRFNQIFVNLLSNAVKFTPVGGKVELTIQEHSHPSENIFVKRFIVKDNGIGMSQDFLPHAFESFKQEYRKETSEHIKGTGLGLAIVKEIVDLMGGEVSVESKIGEGTTFIVDLPLEVMGVQEIEEEKPTLENSLQGIHILLGEDNDINTEIAVALLEKQGCTVDCAEDGKETLQLFKKSKKGFYDVILMDIRMPIMDGLEASRAIRAVKRADAKEIPIIALTADVFSEDAKIAKEAGMNTLLAKPIQPQVLYQTLYEYTRREK